MIKKLEKVNTEGTENLLSISKTNSKEIVTINFTMQFISSLKYFFLRSEIHAEHQTINKAKTQ